MSEAATTVRLRPVEATDWQAVHSWGSLPEFCRYQAWGPNTPEQSRTFVEAAVAAWSQNPQTRHVYVAYIGEQVVGMGELRVRESEHRQGEISYGLHPRCWGRGLGTMLGRELLRIGFEYLSLHRVYATCDPRNLGSAGVIRRLGMAYEGRLRHTLLIRDGWRDSDIYSILEDEWRAKDHQGRGLGQQRGQGLGQRQEEGMEAER
jgi:ribosomal-protein-alanine N-acetyltransferase